MSGAANEATGLFFPQLLHDFAVNPAEVGLAFWQHKIRYQIYLDLYKSIIKFLVFRVICVILLVTGVAVLICSRNS